MNTNTKQNTVPYTYSYNNILPEIFSVPEIVLKRTLHLLMPSLNESFSNYSLIKKAYNYFTPNKKLFTRESKNWPINRSAIIKSLNSDHLNKVIIKLPFQNMFLNDAIKKGYIKIENVNGKLSISIPYRQPNTLNINFLNKDLIAEVASTFAYSMTSIILSSLNLNQNIYVKLQCAALLGLAKGITKFLCGNCTLSLTPWKTLVEIFAEITTELSLFVSGKQYNAFEVNALKGFYKYMFDQYFSGYDLMNITSGSLDAFKSGFKGFVKTYFATLLMNHIVLGHTVGSILGAIISAGFINIFIDHCTL